SHLQRAGAARAVPRRAQRRHRPPHRGGGGRCRAPRDPAAAVTTAQPTSRSRDREQRSALALAGSLAVACNLAVAQPVLDLLARNPEFFAARRAPAVDVVLVALAMALLLPAALVAVVAAVRRVSPAAGALLHAVLLAVLGAAIAVQLLDALVPWP